MKRVHFIIHAEFEQPGIITSWAKQRNMLITYSRPFAKEQLPDPTQFDWLVVMGGPQSPLEPQRYLYLKDEIELTKKALDQDKTVLGFCLGAQIIGEALGGKTERSPHKEVGVFPINLTEDGKKDPLFHNLPHTFLELK